MLTESFTLASASRVAGMGRLMARMAWILFAPFVWAGKSYSSASATPNGGTTLHD